MHNMPSLPHVALTMTCNPLSCYHGTPLGGGWEPRQAGSRWRPSGGVFNTRQCWLLPVGSQWVPWAALPRAARLLLLTDQPTPTPRRAHQAKVLPPVAPVGLFGAEEALGGLLGVALHIGGGDASSGQSLARFQRLHFQQSAHSCVLSTDTAATPNATRPRVSPVGTVPTSIHKKSSQTVVCNRDPPNNSTHPPSRTGSLCTLHTCSDMGKTASMLQVCQWTVC